MFEICMRTEFLKKVIEVVKDLTPRVNIEITEDGIQLREMDISQISYIVVTLSADDFEKIYCEKSQIIGVDLTVLLLVLKNMASEEFVTLKLGGKQDDLVVKGKASYFEIPLLMIESGNIEIPDTEYEGSARMMSSEFQKICRDLSSMASDVSIDLQKDQISFLIQGKVGKGNIVCQKNVIFDVENPVKVSFSLRYLCFFAKATTISNEVDICLSKDFPMLLEYKTGHSIISFYLAPKIEDE